MHLKSKHLVKALILSSVCLMDMTFAKEKAVAPKSEAVELQAKSCFLVKEGNKVIHSQGACKRRYSPCSTFKIAISLMGYDQGILIDEHHPVFPFKPGYPAYIKSWQQSQDPSSWIKNSCFWYSQEITQKLGLKKFKEYLKRFNYGNQNIGGKKDKGLTNAWDDASLKISPLGETRFLQALLDGRLGLSSKAYAMTKALLYLDTLPQGWKVYGKTGSCATHGWFVGWVEKGNKHLVFAKHLVYDKRPLAYIGPHIKAEALQELNELLSKKPD